MLRSLVGSEMCIRDSNIAGRSFCALADGAVAPIMSSLKYFRDEYLAHQRNGGCPFDPIASTIFKTVGA